MDSELEKIRDLLFSPDVANRNLGVQLIHSLKYSDSPFYKDVKRCVEVLAKETPNASVHTLVKLMLANGISVKYNRQFVFLKAFEVLIPIVKEITLYGCQLTTFPDVILKFTQLKRICLQDNMLLTIPHTVYNLPLLEELDIQQNNFSFLQGSIKNAQQLKKLLVSSYKYTILPKELALLPQLEELVWGILSITNQAPLAIPSVIWDCVGLKKLTIFGEEINALSPSIGQLTVLRELELKRLGISILPSQLGQLEQIEHLSLANLPNLKQLPEFIFSLPKLKELSIYNVPITNISDNIYNCHTLEYIYIANTKISPEKITILEDTLLAKFPNSRVEVS